MGKRRYHQCDEPRQRLISVIKKIQALDKDEMKKTRKALYEGMYILSATLSDESMKKAFAKISDGITQRGGAIRKIHDMGRKKLAYEMNGKKEGHYYLLFFEAPTQIVSELWKEYHLNEDLIRFVTFTTDEVQESLEFKPLKREIM